AALYGSRANNGALIITTKSGKARQSGLGVSFNSNTSFNTVLRWPDYQYEYGQGNINRNAEGALYYSYQASKDGVNTGSTSSSWGPQYERQLFFHYDRLTEGQAAARTPWVAHIEASLQEFWQTGYTLQISHSLEGRDASATARGSISPPKNDWTMPNSG